METAQGENAEELLRRGIEHIGRGETLAALSFVEKSFQMKQTPRCRSYMGYLAALERGKISEGIRLCSEAIDEDPENSVHYLNLGRVLYKASMKREAIDTVRKGLAREFNREASDWLESIGVRKKPVFPFLGRNHFLNKYMGIVLRRLNIR